MNSLVLSLMIIHYFQRSFIYAFLIRSSKSVPISITFFAFLFYTWNGFQQGLSLTQVNQVPGDFLSPNILVGVGMWLLGFFGNLRGADSPSLLGIYLHVSYKFIHRRRSKYIINFSGFCNLYSCQLVAAWAVPSSMVS